MLLLVPVVFVGISLVGLQMIERSRTSMRIAASDLNYIQTRLCAQQCVAVTANQIQKRLEDNQPIAKETVDCECENPSGESRAMRSRSRVSTSQ